MARTHGRLQIFISWQTGQEPVAAFLAVKCVTVVRDSIGHNQVVGSHGGVVAGDLIERFLFDLHVGRLAFGHENGFSTPVIDDNVGAMLDALMRKARLDGGTARRKSPVLNEVLYQVLADPFFGREAHMFPSKRIENRPSPAGGANVKIVLTWKVERLHNRLLKRLSMDVE